MAVSVVSAARSEVGPVRRNNQDSGYAGVRLAVVADGVGGNAAGEVASATAVHELLALDAGPVPADPRADLEAAFARAQAALERRVAGDPATQGMATTLTALLSTGDELVLAHIGDSRCYRLHDGALQQITRDDTFVQELMDGGHISAEQAAHHPLRHAITASLGDAGSPTRVSTAVHAAVAGDRWLLCSDGLSGAVGADALTQVLAGAPDAATCADRLVDLALEAGATDNVTCVVVDLVGEGGAPPPGPGVVGAAAEPVTAG